MPPNKNGFQPHTALLLSIMGALILSLSVCIKMLIVPVFELDTDPDANMRISQIRDWIAGQSWFDLRLQRYGLEGSTPMHWTRLGDLGPAGLIVLLTPLFGQARAENIAVTLYPLALLIPLFFCAIWAAHRIVPTARTRIIGMALLLIGLQLSVLFVHFTPGNIDHHNLQIIALAIFVGGCVGKRTFPSGLIAASGLVGGLVIGLDAIPHIAAAVLALGLLWLFEPAREKAFLNGLGLGTLGFVAICAPVFIPQPWTTQWCDSWTVPLAAIFLGFGGAVLLIAGPIGALQQIWQRALASAVVGGGVLITLLLVFPACRNPLPLQDPLIDQFWMTAVAENNNAFKMIKAEPTLASLWLIPILAGFAYGLAQAKRWVSLRATLPLSLAYLVGFGFAIVYARGMPMLMLLMLLMISPVIVELFQRNIVPLKRLTIYTLLSAGIALLIGYFRTLQVPQLQSKETAYFANMTLAQTNCLDSEAMTRIQSLPPGLMIASFGQTEYLLRHTKQNVALAGYHRGKDDNLWIMRWLIATPDVAKAMLAEHRPDYLSICGYSGQFNLMSKAFPNSLVARAFKGEPPDWLQPVLPLSSDGMIYRIVP